MTKFTSRLAFGLSFRREFQRHKMLAVFVHDEKQDRVPARTSRAWQRVFDFQGPLDGGVAEAHNQPEVVIVGRFENTKQRFSAGYALYSALQHGAGQQYQAPIDKEDLRDRFAGPSDFAPAHQFNELELELDSIKYFGGGCKQQPIGDLIVVGAQGYSVDVCFPVEHWRAQSLDV